MGKQKKSNGSSTNKKSSAGNSSGENARFIAGLVLLVFSLYMLVVFISYVLTGNADQDSLSPQPEDTVFEYRNWGGKFGFKIGHYFIYSGFGLGSFFIPLIIGAFGLALLKVRYFRLWKNILRFLLATVIISAILGYLAGQSTFLGAGPGGEFGYMIAHRLNELMGKVGTGAVLLVITVTYLIFALHVSPQTLRKPIDTVARAGASALSGEGRKKDIITEDVKIEPEDNFPSVEEEPLRADEEETDDIDDFYQPPSMPEDRPLVNVISKGKKPVSDEPSSEELLSDLPPFDPRLSLPRYKF
ncbi:hypothetical protein EG830_09915, partial [bacterium]|nr:hypothetical protein [bacterium]